MNETEMAAIQVADPIKRKVPTRKSNHTVRHIRALMHKNAINWRRTWKGSICEVFCPVALMLLLVWIRTLVKVDSQDSGNPYGR